jgi:hypothetical protein
MIYIYIYMELSQGNSLCSYLYLKQAKISLVSFFFYKIGEQEGRQILPKGGWYQWYWGGGGEMQ